MILHQGTLASHKEGTWTPVVSASTGALGAYTATGKYIKDGKKVMVTIAITITNNGTGAGSLKVAGLPFQVDGDFHVGHGFNGITAKSLTYYAYPGSNDSFVRGYDAAYPVVSGDLVLATCTYMASS